MSLLLRYIMYACAAMSCQAAVQRWPGQLALRFLKLQNRDGRRDRLSPEPEGPGTVLNYPGEIANHVKDYVEASHGVCNNKMRE